MKLLKRKIKYLPVFLGVVAAFMVIAYCAVTFVDFALLAGSTRYADGPIGMEGRMPASAKAYKRLKASPLAVPIFKMLERNGTAEGKLYALYALESLDNGYFQSLEAKYQESNKKASCMSGCILYEVYLRTVFESSKAT